MMSMDYIPHRGTSGWCPTSIRGAFVSGTDLVDSLPVTFNADGIAEVVYRSPESFVRWGTSYEREDKDIPERSIQPTVDLQNYFKTQKDPLPTIRLKRPPVVLVHGLWGDESAWDVFEPKFNDKKVYGNQNKIRRVNYYEEGQVRSIVEHVPKLQSKVDGAISEAKKKLFTVSKVDVIAHSMGGLLTRQYCFDNQMDCQNKIRRFITIATPHFGSELADLLLVYRNIKTRNLFSTNEKCLRSVDSFVRGGKIEVAWPFEKSVEAHPIDPEYGAIDDLATGRLPDFIQSSTTGSRWSNPNYLPLSENFSAHTIIGLTPSSLMGIDVQILGLWKFILSRCGFTRENVFGTEADSNDRIVGRSSQEGGVLSNYSTQVFDTDHFTVRNADKTIDQIRILLDKPSDSGMFTK